MKKHLILIVLVIYTCSIYAQTESATDTIPNGWDMDGKIREVFGLGVHYSF